MDDLDKRIAEANNEFISEEDVGDNDVANLAVADLYQERQNIQHDYAKKSFPRGSSVRVKAMVQDVVSGAGTRSLAQAYGRAKDESDALQKIGETARAQMVKNQYMQDSFLPAVEIVVNFTSPDELLNCEEGLRALDKYALGVGSMSGYTEAYVREAYADLLGKVSRLSSPEVTDAVARINGYLDTAQNVLAVGLAKKIKDKVNAGKIVASEDDYQFLLMVANSKGIR